MINPTGKKLENLLFGMFDDAVKGVDTYNHNGSMWLIFTDEMRWVVEFTQTRTLWYNYYFFKQEMEIIGLDCIENKDLIQKWFESRFLNMGDENAVEDTIQNGVKDTSFVNPYYNQNVEDTIQNGVKHTESIFLVLRPKVEDTIQNGVKHTQWNQIQHDIRVEDTIQNGVKETLSTAGKPLRVEDTIQNGVKKIRWNGEVGTHIFEDVVQNGVKEMKEISDSSLTSEIFKVNCKKTIRDGVKDTVQQKFNVSREVEDVIQKGVKHCEDGDWLNGDVRFEDIIQNGVKHTESLPENNPARIEDTVKNGVKEIIKSDFYRKSRITDVTQNGVKESNWKKVDNFPDYAKRVIKNGIKDC